MVSEALSSVKRGLGAGRSVERAPREGLLGDPSTRSWRLTRSLALLPGCGYAQIVFAALVAVTCWRGRTYGRPLAVLGFVLRIFAAALAFRGHGNMVSLLSYEPSQRGEMSNAIRIVIVVRAALEAFLMRTLLRPDTSKYFAHRAGTDSSAAASGSEHGRSSRRETGPASPDRLPTRAWRFNIARSSVRARFVPSDGSLAPRRGGRLDARRGDAWRHRAHRGSGALPRARRLAPRWRPWARALLLRRVSFLLVPCPRAGVADSASALGGARDPGVLGPLGACSSRLGRRPR